MREGGGGRDDEEMKEAKPHCRPAGAGGRGREKVGRQKREQRRAQAISALPWWYAVEGIEGP